jgi:hypothetical protein
MDNHVVKFKRIDTGKYWIAGNVKVGKYGPQIGMKKTPELKAYFDSVSDGGWINLSIDKPYEKKAAPELNDEIPF